MSSAFSWDDRTTATGRFGVAFTAGIDHKLAPAGKTTGEWYLGTVYENWRDGDFFINAQGKLALGIDSSRTVALTSVTRVAEGNWWLSRFGRI
jgi:hypothetical protein